MAAITDRIGCIVPSINVTVEDDFRALCQTNTGVHFARADVDQSVDLADQFDHLVELGTTVRAVVRFLQERWDEVHSTHITVGMPFEIREGDRIVGHIPN